MMQSEILILFGFVGQGHKLTLIPYNRKHVNLMMQSEILIFILFGFVGQGHKLTLIPYNR